MSGCCISLKSWCSELTAEKIESYGDRINPLYFRIATVVLGVVAGILIIAARRQAFGPIGSFGFKAAYAAGAATLVLNLSLFAIIWLASWEKKDRAEREALVNLVHQMQQN